MRDGIFLKVAVFVETYFNSFVSRCFINNQKQSMLNNLLKQYAAYNSWANKQLLSAVVTLPEEKIKEEISSSFPGIFKTVQHMLDADTIWWQRMKLQDNIERPSVSFTGNFDELQKMFLRQSALIEEWVSGLNEYQLNHVFGYYRERVMYKQTVQETLLHMFNHATYHRGQIVTMLRQLSVTKIPATDYVVYMRLKSK